MVDCNDQDCAADPACQPPVVEICDNGIDDNGDGFVDCADPDCTNDPACQPPSDGKVTICHIPPGNPANAKTKTIGADSVPDHLAHGDFIGVCN
jgi:hypothetical protein